MHLMITKCGSPGIFHLPSVCLRPKAEDGENDDMGMNWNSKNRLTQKREANLMNES